MGNNIPEAPFLPYVIITGAQAVSLTNWPGIPNCTSDSFEGISNEKLIFDSPIDFNNEKIFGASGLDGYFWSIDESQTGLSGDKEGGFDITTTGLGTFLRLLTTGSRTASSGSATVNRFANTLVASANDDVLIQNLIDPTFTLGAFTTVKDIAQKITDGSVWWNRTTEGIGITPTSGIGVRMMWVASKGAFRAGRVYNTGDAVTNYWDEANIGGYSAGFGSNTKVSGANSLGNGDTITVSGENSAGNGTLITVSGNNARGHGTSGTASGTNSDVGGNTCTASGTNSTSRGFHTIGSGLNATSFGCYTIAAEWNSIAGGNYTKSLGQSAFVMGDNENEDSTSFIAGTSASTYGSVAMGYASVGKTLKAQGTASGAWGQDVNALTNNNIFAIGKDFSVNNKESFFVGFSGLPALQVTDSYVEDEATYQGVWSETTQYARNDFVKYTTPATTETLYYVVYSATPPPIGTVPTNTTYWRVVIDGKVGINLPFTTYPAVGRPTAQLHIAGSDGSAGTAPIKLTEGDLLDSIELGAIELSSAGFYGTRTLGGITTRGRFVLDSELGSYQPLDAGLTDISGLAVTDGNIIVGDGANWVAESGATARASLGLTIGTDVLAYRTFGTAANSATGDFLAYNGTAVAVSNATLTTALTVNTGTLTLTANAANNSVLTIGAGAVSVSGSNTGDQTSVSGNAGTVTGLSVVAGQTLTVTTGGTLVMAGYSLTLAQSGTLGTAAYTAATAYAPAVGINTIVTVGTITSGKLDTGAVIGGVTMTLGADAPYDMYYRSVAGVLTRIQSVGNGIFVTSSASVPSWSGDIPTGITIGSGYIYRAGGTDVPVADGGAGRGSATAYAVICGGTTTTGAHQSIASVGTAGQVLTSNGAAALPTFQVSTKTSGKHTISTGDITVSSTSFGDTGFSVTLVTATTALVCFVGSASKATGTIFLDIILNDTTRVGGGTYGLLLHAYTVASFGISFSVLVTGLTAGSNKFELQARIDSGNATIYASSGHAPTLSVIAL